MIASPGSMTPTNQPPVKEAPASNRIPQWEQIPAEKRRQLTQILAELLLKQMQPAGVKHEQPS